MVNPKDIFHASITNKYTSSICNDRFFQEYIQRTFQPHMKSVILQPHLNWKSYLNILVNGITLPAEIMTITDPSNILNARVNVRFGDTLQAIWENFRKIVNDKYLNMKLYNVRLIGTVGDKNLILTIYRYYSRLGVLEDPTGTIQAEVRGITYNNMTQIFKDTPITKIDNDANFYLNLEKIWVYIAEKIIKII
jgi:hypothetical protein